MTDPSPAPLEALSAALAELTRAAAASVVGVHSHRAASSGFVWRADLVVTADEALADEGEVAVALAGGERRAARIVGRDAGTDVALLRVDGGGLEARGLAPEIPAAGSLALVVGAAGGMPLAALGVVAAAGPAWRSMRGGEIDARIELGLRLRRETEGGLVLDAAGRAIGMAVFGPRRRVLVIPAATIGRVAEALERDGRVARGYLGLALHPVRVDGGEGEGAMVMSVDARGPGGAAGVRQGDVIVAWDGAKLPGINRLLRSLGPDSVGRRVTLGLRRGGAPLDLPLTIGERPAA